MKAETFGQVLRRVRLKSGKSLGEVARWIGVTVPYLSDIERGRRNAPSRTHIGNISALLEIESELLEAAAGVPAATLLYEYDEEDPRLSWTRNGVARMLHGTWPTLTMRELIKIQKILDNRENR